VAGRPLQVALREFELQYLRRALKAADNKRTRAAEMLGANLAGITEANGREVLAATLAAIVKDTGGPEGVSAFGYSETDVSGLVDGTLKQERLLSGCPRDVGRPELQAIIRASMRF